MSRLHPIIHTHLDQKKRLSGFDRVITIAAIVYPLTGIPQVLDVLSGDVQGVSLTSWLGFVVFSGLFLVYGIVNQLRPIIITNALWLVVNSLVVIGILVNS